MRKYFILLTFLLSSLCVRAQERIFVITDRSTYIAGDLVYCSLFAMDNEGRPSGFSAISYLELISADGTVAEVKVGLFEGRGAGSFRIPTSAPTGNYSLVAYTAQSQAAPGSARTLAVFNTTSTARVKGGVTLVPESQFTGFDEPEMPSQGGLSLSLPARIRQEREATLVIGALDQDASLAVTVYHDDALAPRDGKTLSGFLHGAPAKPGTRSGEYEGEIVYASVEGLATDPDGQVTAFLSSAGSPSNVYVGRTQGEGQLQFFTGNIYGDRELVCEVQSDDRQPRHINLLSPFVHPETDSLPSLLLSSAQRNRLIARKSALSAEALLQLDTLVRFMPKREDLLLEGQPVIRYHLDDYNRFPSVREIIVEFVRELQYSRRNGRWQVRLNTSDATNSRRYVQDNILVMMDGVVLSDHGMLEGFDAMLLDDIDIYPQPFVLGGVPFNGLVNFISKKNYVTALQFPENVRVVDFKGVSYPVAYTGGVPSGTARDVREVLYWHPALQTKAGAQERLRLKMPSYAGKFRVVAEGLKADGTPVRAEYSFVTED